MKDLDPSSLPSSWYSVTDRLRKICDKLKIRVSGALAVAYCQYFRESDIMLWFREITTTDPATGEIWYLGWTAAIRGRAQYHAIAEDIRSAIWADCGQDLTACATLLVD